jgi:hypothetical protein
MNGEAGANPRVNPLHHSARKLHTDASSAGSGAGAGSSSAHSPPAPPPLRASQPPPASQPAPAARQPAPESESAPPVSPGGARFHRRIETAQLTPKGATSRSRSPPQDGAGGTGGGVSSVSKEDTRLQWDLSRAFPRLLPPWLLRHALEAAFVLSCLYYSVFLCYFVR